MLEKIKIEQFDLVYGIMEQSFPVDEVRPYEEQKDLLDNPLYSVYIPAENKDDIKVFIAAWEFESFIFIEHFAVNKKYRNGGVGSKMLAEFVGMQTKRVCLEVELPETEIAARRIGFYERNGFFLNEYEYFQPPISRGKNIVPLAIMTSGNFTDSETFQNIRNVLYKEVYKYKNWNNNTS